MEPAQAFPGGKVKIIVTANRDSGFDGEITLNAPTGLPPTIPVPKSMPAIEKGKTKCSFMLDLNPKTPLGAHFVTVGAKGKHQDKEIAANGLLLVELVAPFELKVEPAEVLLKPGRGAKLKVTAIRHGGYKGPIALELRKLPPMVTVVGKAIINADQTTTEVEIAAGPKTAAGTATVEVAGSATGLNSFQQVSSSFSLRVEKK